MCNDPVCYTTNNILVKPGFLTAEIDDDGIVIYFGLYEIAPYYIGIPKFKMKFNRFSKYLNYN